MLDFFGASPHLPHVVLHLLQVGSAARDVRALASGEVHDRRVWDALERLQWRCDEKITVLDFIE